jgi:hypothetical protein
VSEIVSLQASCLRESLIAAGADKLILSRMSELVLLQVSRHGESLIATGADKLDLN